MTKNFVAVISFPDYGTEKRGKLFIWDGVKVAPKTFTQLANNKKTLVFLDFSSVAAEAVARGAKLPTTVVDLEELIVAVSKEPNVRKIRSEFSEAELLKRFGLTDDQWGDYKSLKHNSPNFDNAILEAVGRSLLRAFRVLSRLASIRGEWNRFSKVEMPVAIILNQHLLDGIRFDPVKLQQFREKLDFDYYKALKSFSAKHNLPLDIPSNTDLERILSEYGFDLSNSSVDSILEFLSIENDLGADVLNLRSLRSTRDALNGISHKKNTSYPHLVSQATRTSRILLRSPTLQHISKKYRSVLIPADGKELSYIDYDQFEVGIMGALSDDPVLLQLYSDKDLYKTMSSTLFGDEKKRGKAKKLFLSYAYGMRMQNLIEAAVALGSTKKTARSAFSQFNKFETWKTNLTNELNANRKIGTLDGNNFYLGHKNKPSSKDVRSAVSQKVQGTGSLIFKQALIAVHELGKFRIVLPMHDAVLVEHDQTDDPKLVVEAFENTMTEVLAKKVKGKASISNFSIE